MKKKRASKNEPDNESTIRQAARPEDRRKTVCGPSFANDQTPVDVNPKSSSEIKRLKQILKTIPILNTLDEKTLQQVVMAMKQRTVTKDEVIINEGDVGDFFYVVESGSFEASHTVKGKHEVIQTYKDSGHFGELSLLYDQPRGATITALTDGKLWALSRSNFKKTVIQKDNEKRKAYMELFKKVDLLHNLKEEERNKLSDALESITYAKGTTIINQGDPADGMYFIESGMVSITLKDNDDKPVNLKTLHTGDYFGELALLTKSPRAASAVAETDVVVAFLNVDAFERLLGNCNNIMMRNAKTYPKQIKKLFNSNHVPNMRTD